MEEKDIKDIITAAGTEVSKEGISRFCNFLNKIFGGAAEQFGGLLSDVVSVWRWKNRLKLQDKVEEELKKRGINEPKPVLPKLAIKLIENASLEEGEELRQNWANMLTNAMDPNYKENIRVAFVEILNQLSKEDILILNVLNVIYQRDYKEGVPLEKTILQDDTILLNTNLSENKYKESIDNLTRLRLCVPAALMIGKGFSKEKGANEYFQTAGTKQIRMTTLGLSFLKAVS